MYTILQAKYESINKKHPPPTVLRTQELQKNKERVGDKAKFIGRRKRLQIGRGGTGVWGFKRGGNRINNSRKQQKRDLS